MLMSVPESARGIVPDVTARDSAGFMTAAISTRLPRAHHKHMKPTNMPERLNQKIKRGTHVSAHFPDEAACLRPVRASAVGIHGDWQENTRYLNMEKRKGHRKQALPEQVAVRGIKPA